MSVKLWRPLRHPSVPCWRTIHFTSTGLQRLGQLPGSSCCACTCSRTVAAGVCSSPRCVPTAAQLAREHTNAHVPAFHTAPAFKHARHCWPAFSCWIALMAAFAALTAAPCFFLGEGMCGVAVVLPAVRFSLHHGEVTACESVGLMLASAGTWHAGRSGTFGRLRFCPSTVAEACQLPG